MKNYPLQEIPESGFFTKATYLDAQFVITTPEIPLTKNMARTISEWGFTEVYSDGEPSEHYTSDISMAGNDDQEENLYAAIGDQSTISDLDKIKEAEQFCITFQKYVKTLFAFLPIRNDLDFNSVAEEIKTICNYVREKRRFLLRTQWLTSPIHDEDQMVSHAVRSTIIALILGTSLKLQNHRLIELGVTALLHEVGMIKLPREIFLKKEALTEQERKLLSAHPILGFNLLKSFNFPLVVSLGALEHHERENGTGYPQHKTGDKISLYAKIIAVACSYEAMLSYRPHKGAKDGHVGILELMKNEGKQYDDAVIRALVYSLSIYPIGLYVLLSNGKKGQVIDTRTENPRFPIVQIFGELMPNGKNRTVQTTSDSCYIIRPLSPEELTGRE